MLRITILIAFIISMSFCDWVEIPQSSISLSSDKVNRKSDGNSLYVYPTTTTARPPILAKPTPLVRGKTQSKNNRASSNNKNDKKKNFNTKNNVTPNNSNINTNKVNNLNNKKSIERFDDVKNIQVVDNNLEEEDVEEEDEDEQYSYASFVPYLSTIQSTLMRNAHQNRKSKVGVLTNLRDHLLYEIQNRIKTIWQPRTSKEARHQNDSNLDFPSNEAALMTIGFLTFAVFLIKLILRLVQAINNKLNMNNTNTAFFGRKRRDVIDDEQILILNYIDQYSFQ